MKQNPLTNQREAMGLSRRDFALMYGLNYSLLGNVETGYAALPKNWEAKLAGSGIDFPALRQANDDWRAALVEALKSAKGA